jgi:hypothetical protein
MAAVPLRIPRGRAILKRGLATSVHARTARTNSSSWGRASVRTARCEVVVRRRRAGAGARCWDGTALGPPWDGTALGPPRRHAQRRGRARSPWSRAAVACRQHDHGQRGPGSPTGRPRTRLRGCGCHAAASATFAAGVRARSRSEVRIHTRADHPASITTRRPMLIRRSRTDTSARQPQAIMPTAIGDADGPERPSVVKARRRDPERGGEGSRAAPSRDHRRLGSAHDVVQAGDVAQDARGAVGCIERAARRDAELRAVADQPNHRRVTSLDRDDR